MSSEQGRIQQQVEVDLKEFYKVAAPLLEDVELGRTTLSAALAEMDNLRDGLTTRFADTYEPYLRAVEQLAAGIDLDSALTYADARQETLETRLGRIQSLAQLGISVEILTHELHTLNQRLEMSLRAFPETVKDSKEFKEANQARQELVERLRFLSQIQVSESDIRRRITGADILAYMKAFFERTLLNRGVALEATDSFERAAFYEFPSRIFPVFINLVNNSIYWLADQPDKQILFSTGDGSLIISDTGPGIDPEDIDSLFELFFTRRVRGRGVGLYLSRQTLAAGGHTIEYVKEGPAKVLSGANFLIKLRDGFDA
ncbi:sensor histidine kinase [Pseudanabaenaceae cyanobacterium LEGE 13415]|nr:sensor histidine kinase [Pseudanabaenaceae cyanobacterium LEGE 13415]